MCHNVVVAERHNERSRPPCRLPRSIWILRSVFFSGPRGRFRGRDCHSQEIEACGVAAFFQSAGAVPGRRRGLRDRPPLGVRIDGARPPVRLLPPNYAKAYLKRGKNDAADAEAICEAVARPNMRFVPVKSEEQQGVLVLHRVRELLVRQRTMLVNGLRAHMAEFGIIVPQGIQRLPELVAALQDETTGIPQIARQALAATVVQIDNLTTSIRQMERRIAAWCRTSTSARRLATIPGVGPITASALAATITDPTLFRSGRHLAAWFALVPRQYSTGGKAKLGRITKMGDQYLRKLLIVGMTAVIRSARRTKAPVFAWVNALLERRPARLVSVALANKAARIACAILIRGESYREPTITRAAA
jgi:transposase